VSWSGISTYQTGFQNSGLDGRSEFYRRSNGGTGYYSANITNAASTQYFIRVVTVSAAAWSGATQTIYPRRSGWDVVEYEPFNYGSGKRAGWTRRLVFERHDFAGRDREREFAVSNWPARSETVTTGLREMTANACR